MRFLKKHMPVTLLVLLTSLMLISCQDKKLLAEEDSLKRQIKVLETELQETKEQLVDNPGSQLEAMDDVNNALKSVNSELEVSQRERKQLEDELLELEKQFLEYQRKYSVN
ncbi:hypothetical protein OAI07_02300 [Akkermansiaceae bacterium]|nr:hypothetical protein [Akkermansiaceae bacterium]